MMNGNPAVTRRQLYQQVRQCLTAARIEDAATEAAFLLEFLFSMPLPRILMDGNFPVPDAILEQAHALCEKRMQRYPLQYLLGAWEFYGISTLVGEGVLIPRQDTEALVETVLELRQGTQATHLLDLCSGSGCIPAAIATQLTGVSGTAIEKEAAAFSYLKQNLERYAPQMQCMQADALRKETVQLCMEADVITCNPPYLTAEEMHVLQAEVQKEPATALFGGEDGLLFYREITALWKPILKDGGWLVYEIGATQGEAVMEILRENGFLEIACRQDAAGKDRVVLGCK